MRLLGPVPAQELDRAYHSDYRYAQKEANEQMVPEGIDRHHLAGKIAGDSPEQATHRRFSLWSLPQSILSPLAVLLIALALAGARAEAEVTVKDGRFWFNGVRQEMVWGASCFKLSNVVTYHFAGEGGGPYGLGPARDFVDHMRGLGFDACRVLLETAGWGKCESGPLANDGKPDNCMWGSEPVDKGFWDVAALQTGGRPLDMHPIGKQTLRWFFETSQETGFMFELVIIATLKHSDVDVPQQSQVIRQVMVKARELQEEFPQALVVMNGINEFGAHSEWGLAGANGVNQLAIRNDRCKAPDGRTVVTLACPPGFDPEQWAGGPFIVDDGGSNRAVYEIGPEPGRFRGAFVHPERGETWHLWPDVQEKAWMISDARGMPWGATESMYYVEPEDEARGRTWYRTAGDRLNGWTTDWPRYESFLNHVAAAGMAYFVVHDEKHAQASTTWPRPETRVERWAIEHLGGTAPPPPPPKQIYFDPIIDGTYRLVLGRPTLNDPAALATYNPWMRDCVSQRPLPTCIDALELALFESPEYREKFTR